MLVTLPFVLLLLDYWPLGRFQLATAKPPLPATAQRVTLTRIAVEKIPFFALSALSCVLTFLVQRACGAMIPLAKTPFELRVANALVAYARYLGKTFWPAKLAVFYPYSHLSVDSWQVMGAALLLLIATVAIVLAARKQPCLLIGWLWFLGTLVPVIGLVQVGKQALADRYTYLPHIGLFILIVWGSAAVIARLRRPRLISVVAAGLAVAGWDHYLTPTVVLARHQDSFPTRSCRDLPKLCRLCGCRQCVGRGRQTAGGHRAVPEVLGNRPGLSGGPQHPGQHLREAGEI